MPCYKSSMAKLHNRSISMINWRIVTFLLLLCQHVALVRPEDVPVDDGSLRPAGGGKGPSFKVAPFTDLHFTENAWTDDGHEQDLNSKLVMSTVQDRESPEIKGIQKSTSIPSLKKPRFLCLHGHGFNAATLEKQVAVWPEFVIDKMDLVFINGPFLLQNNGTSVSDHFVWFTLNKVTMDYDNFEEGIAYIEDRMIELGPFDGVLGFSEGAFVTGALPGMQEQGVCLKKVGKIEHVVIISGAKIGGKSFPIVPKLSESAYLSPINIPSLHIFGKNDKQWPNSPELVEAYVDPLVINHNGGHEVPKLDEKGLKTMIEFLKKINAIA